MFPFLISGFAQTWNIKLVGAIVLSILIVAVCFALGIDWGNGVAFSVVAAFPLTRLFEFVLGMCAALLWRRLPKSPSGWSTAAPWNSPRSVFSYWPLIWPRTSQIPVRRRPRGSRSM